MDPVVLAAGIQTGGNILGSLMGGKSKAPAWQPWMKAAVGPGNVKAGVNTLTKVQAFMDDYLMGAKMKAAKKHGIHPLVALGIPPSAVGGEASIGGDVGASGQVAAELGQGIGRAVEAYATKDEREVTSVLQRLAVERGQLENESLKSDIALKRAQLAPAMPNQAIPTLIAGQGDTRYPEQRRMPMGYGDTAPMLRMGRDDKGNVIRTWNDDLGDNEIMQALSALAFSVPDWIHGNIGRPAARAISNRWKQTPIYKQWKGGK